MSWRGKLRELRSQVAALAIAAGDPAVPWYAKLVTAMVVGYALSPIDLIPDFIPLVGYLDDMLLLPLGIALAIRLIPEPVWQNCLERAKAANGSPRRSWIAAATIVCIWVAGALFAIRWLRTSR